MEFAAPLLRQRLLEAAATLALGETGENLYGVEEQDRRKPLK
jgi:hypothetical protein